MSDWFEHWAAKGVKPFFLCEYGVPFTWDWTMYRGWYKGEREFGSAGCRGSFASPSGTPSSSATGPTGSASGRRGTFAGRPTQFRAGSLWHRWDYPAPVGSSDFDERQAVFARYLADNWRAHRTWGLSANSPWEYATFWKLRDGADTSRKEFKVDWDNLQQPGFSPDYSQTAPGMDEHGLRARRTGSRRRRRRR